MGNYGRKGGKDLGGNKQPEFLSDREEAIQDDIDVVLFGRRNLEQLAQENERDFNDFMDESGEDYFA